MTSDVSARHVVCDAGPTKVRRKLKKGVIPYLLPSTSGSRNHLVEPFYVFQNHSIFKVKILFNTINSYMGNLRDIVFILLERNIYIQKRKKINKKSLRICETEIGRAHV